MLLMVVAAVLLVNPATRQTDRALLAACGALRQTVTGCPGFPCRVSLADAHVGETVLLINHLHQPANSPYRASHAIYVREMAEQYFPEIGEVPEVLSRRVISVRAFDAEHMMVDGVAIEGTQLKEVIGRMLADPTVSYIHLHYAGAGCFAAAVERA